MATKNEYFIIKTRMANFKKNPKKGGTPIRNIAPRRTKIVIILVLEPNSKMF